MTDPSDGRRRAIDALLTALIPPDGPGMAVAVYLGAREPILGGYGLADLEQRTPITPESVFHVASVSKQFTAFAIALLARESKLDLDGDIRRYLPWIADFGAPISIRQLIHHTSGLRDQWSLCDLGGHSTDNRLRQQQILNIVARQRSLNFAPGTQYLYSNTGYTLLAEIVRIVSGRTLRQFTSERIFKPLGMEQTFFYDDVTELVPGRAHSYTRRGAGGSWQRALLNYDNVGATGLLTTAQDMIRWAHNFAHPRVGDRAFIEQITSPGTLRDGTPLIYGFALERRRYAGHEALIHFGADAGFQAVFSYFPGLELSVSMLANFPPHDWAKLITAVVQAFAGEPGGPLADSAPAPTVLPETAVEEFPGHYVAPCEPVIVLKAQDHKLHLRTTGIPWTEVIFRDDGTFDIGGGRRIWQHYRAHHDKAGGIAAIEDLAGAVYGSTKLYRRIDPPTPIAHELTQLVGDYRSAELDITYSFTVEAGLLLARSLWSPRPIVFEATLPDRYDSDHGSMSTIEVIRNTQGHIDGLLVHGIRIRNVLFERVRAP